MLSLSCSLVFYYRISLCCSNSYFSDYICSFNFLFASIAYWLLTLFLLFLLFLYLFRLFL